MRPPPAAVLLLATLAACTSGGGALPDTAGRFFSLDSAGGADTGADPTDTDADTDTDTDDTSDGADPDDTGGDDTAADDGPGAVYPTCAAADAGDELSSGTFVGEVGSWGGSVAVSCDGTSGTGAEVVSRLTLAAGELLEATWTITGRDAVLQLVDSCGTDAVCSASADRSFAGGTERLAWLNQTALPAERYLLLESFGTLSSGDAYGLQVVRTLTSEWPGASVCADAPAVTAGAYHLSLSGDEPDSVPPRGGCGTAGAGDSVALVAVRSGQTLSLRTLALDGVLTAAVTADCTGTCLAGNGASWTNDTGATAEVRVVVESGGSAAEGVLWVSLD